MPTIVYLVHGTGCGSADGTPRAPGDAWTRPVVEAIRWIASTLGLPAPHVLDPIPDTPPPGADEPAAVWLVPVTYHEVFDEFRASSGDRAALAAGLGVLAGADLAGLASTDFVWNNCLDVVLWWADRAQTRNRVAAVMLDAVARADRLASSIPGATTRRVLVSHSLGTAVANCALRHLAQSPAWTARGAFDAWFTLANVAPFLLDAESVYATRLVPGAHGSLVAGYMFDARHELDPIPRLVPRSAFAPEHAGAAAPAWSEAVRARRCRLLDTHGVAAPPGGTPGIAHVHGFANYLMAPAVALPLAALMRGSAFTPGELAARHWPDAWNRLPALRCAHGSQALDRLRDAVQRYASDAPDAAAGSGGPPAAWIGRLLRGAEILASAIHEC